MKKNSNDIIYGLHSVKAIILAKPENILELFIVKDRSDERMQEIIELAQNVDINFQLVERKSMDAMFAQLNHQGVVAKVTSMTNYSDKDLFELLDSLNEEPFLLILDGVQDPHNLGACLRTANALGVHAVIAPKDRAVGLTPVVRKVASGAAEVTPFIQVTNLVRTMQQLKERGIWLYGADGEAEESIFTTKISGAVAIVMGAEGVGLRRLTRENCDFLVKIPMRGTVSSLNVSVATGICLAKGGRP